ncbi:MAG: hypothetical protein HYZ63_02380 [Candidatus Andersenbacteria bacterium]|nr:hypothetical protein [Candidatus Andersenbacteria bacterium]
MKKIIAVVLQVILAWVLGFIAPYTMGIGNGWELVAIPIGMAAGVWIGGALAYGFTWPRLIKALTGAAIGSAILAIPGLAVGFIGILLPFAGAMIGFYLHKQATPVSEVVNA